MLGLVPAPLPTQVLHSSIPSFGSSLEVNRMVPATAPPHDSTRLAPWYVSSPVSSHQDLIYGTCFALSSHSLSVPSWVQSDAAQPAPEAGTWFQSYFETLVSMANPSLWWLTYPTVTRDTRSESCDAGMGRCKRLFSNQHSSSTTFCVCVAFHTPSQSSFLLAQNPFFIRHRSGKIKSSCRYVLTNSTTNFDKMCNSARRRQRIHLFHAFMLKRGSLLYSLHKFRRTLPKANPGSPPYEITTLV